MLSVPVKTGRSRLVLRLILTYMVAQNKAVWKFYGTLTFSARTYSYATCLCTLVNYYLAVWDAQLFYYIYIPLLH